MPSRPARARRLVFGCPRPTADVLHFLHQLLFWFSAQPNPAADIRFLYRDRQEKRSSYAPKEDEAPVRYDGIYRIRSCWRSKGAQGYLVCRYLFIRCDNAPAPWSSEGRRSPHSPLRCAPATMTECLAKSSGISI